MSDRHRVVPAVYVLLRRGDEELLQRRQNTGYMDGFWAVGAAGHIEAGETVTEAAIREVEEEVGVAIVAERLVSLCTMLRTRSPYDPLDERVDFFFECTEWRGTPTIAEPEKISDLRWFNLDDRPTPLVAHEELVLRGMWDGSLAPVMSHGFPADQ